MTREHKAPGPKPLVSTWGAEPKSAAPLALCKDSLASRSLPDSGTRKMGPRDRRLSEQPEVVAQAHCRSPLKDGSYRGHRELSIAW